MLNLVKLMVAMALTLFSVNASAYLLADVGELDTAIGWSDEKFTGEAAEEAWVESIVGEIDYMQIDIGAEDGDFWQYVTDDGLDGTVAFDFSPYNPEFYIVKVGGGIGTTVESEVVLFDNADSMAFAYFSLSEFGPGIVSIGVISHSGISVPEPGVIGLLAVGLLGIGVARRRTNA